VWSLTFESGGHGAQPFVFRAAALSVAADDDAETEQGASRGASRGGRVVRVEEVKKVGAVEGHRYTSQQLETMSWTKENKVAMARYHANAFDGRKSGRAEEEAAQTIQRAWVDNTVDRRARAMETMRMRMYQGLEEVDKALLAAFLLKDNYEEMDDFRKAQRLSRALKYGVPFEVAMAILDSLE
jgi:hypothetical protein